MEKFEVVSKSFEGKITKVVIIDKRTGELQTGVAKCSPNDRMSYDKGFAIAYNRAIVKANEKYCDYLRTVINGAELMIKSAQKELFGEKCEMRNRQSIIDSFME